MIYQKCKFKSFHTRKRKKHSTNVIQVKRRMQQYVKKMHTDIAKHMCNPFNQSITFSSTSRIKQLTFYNIIE